jgi:hypothetical protein
MVLAMSLDFGRAPVVMKFPGLSSIENNYYHNYKF